MEKIYTYQPRLGTANGIGAKDTAEVLGRGGSHYTSNPCKKIIINKKEAQRINEVVLPSIFNAIDSLLKKYR